MGKVYYLFWTFYKQEGKAQGDVKWNCQYHTAPIWQSQDLNSVYSQIHALTLILHFLPWHLLLLSYKTSSVETSQPIGQILIY